MSNCSGRWNCRSSRFAEPIHATSDTEFLPFNLGCQEAADQIISRAASAPFDHGQEVLSHVPVGGAVVGILRSRPRVAGDDIGPLLEAITVLGGYAHELRDHDHRQWLRQLPDKVGRTNGSDPGQQLLRER
jgi:hypothetical protein